MLIDEEKELCELVSWGDMQAREKLFHANYGLIGLIIKEHNVNTGITYEDLYAEGAIGLWRGIEKYKLGKGTKLSSYCKYWIHYRVKKALELKSRVIRVPRYLVQRGIKHLKAKEEIESEINRELSVSELHIFNLANEKGKVAAEACIDCVSIHKKANGAHINFENEEQFTWEDIAADESTSVSETMALNEMLDKLPALLKKLNYRDRRVIKKRFGIGCKKQTLETIAVEEGVTREWVRQLEKDAIVKLREHLISMI